MNRLLVAAARTGQLSALKWLRALCQPIKEPGLRMMQDAASWRQLEILRYLRSGPFPAPWDTEIPSCAAQHFDCLKWLLTQDPPCPCSRHLPWEVARQGSLDALVWLRMHAPLPLSFWNESCTVAAVRRGDLPMVTWLRAQDPPCPWDNNCTLAAVQLGHLQALRAETPPCPWSSCCVDTAVLRGHLETLEWLYIQGLRLDGNLYYHAACNSHPHVLRWLYAQHVPIPTMDTAWGNSRKSPPYLVFLADIGVPLSKSMRWGLRVARRRFCIFHGLLRWCGRAVSDPRGAHPAFDQFDSDGHGRDLLVRLSRLPPELIARITVATGLQHDITICL